VLTANQLGMEMVAIPLSTLSPLSLGIETKHKRKRFKLSFLELALNIVESV
jgi:hypothetical protein